MRTSPPLHISARLEDWSRGLVGRLQRKGGWVPRVEPFTGYGAPGWIRVLGRVQLTAARTATPRQTNHRGWRYFVTAPAPHEPVDITVGGRSWTVLTDRGGYVDARIDVDLEPGWHLVTMRTSDASAAGSILVIGADQRLGVISDIDDTVLVTMVPRPFLAVWNTFGRVASKRQAVPGMAALYSGIAEAMPGTPFIYLSNGAWNTAANLQAFLHRHGFPAGPLLLTDWGPTTTGWFRSGRAHKHSTLERLFAELPGISWLLIGDDGQHDPQIYAHWAATRPDRVAAVAIHTLTPVHKALTQFPVTPGRPRNSTSPVPTATGPDGAALTRELAAVLRAAVAQENPVPEGGRVGRGGRHPD